MKENKELSYEEAYTRIEVIVEKMNAQKVSLEEALKLYEEADQLIISCQKRLTEAEQKIEVLIKNQNGELVLDENGLAQKMAFQSTALSSLNK